jgi:integrase
MLLATQTLEFTRATLRALPPPKTRTYYKDPETRGLLLVVWPNGTQAFELYRKVSGKPTRIGLGHFDPQLPESRVFPKGTDPLNLVGNAPALNVAMARMLAAAVNAQLDMGTNPSEIKRSTRKEKLSELSLQEAFDRYEKDYLIPQDKRTTSDLRNLFERHLGYVAPGQKKAHGRERKKSAYGVDWSKRKLSDITAEEVRNLHNKLKDGHGAHTANRVFELLRALFNKMTEWKLFKAENPCAGVSKFKEQSRERFLTGGELPKFFAALAKVQNENFRDFVQLALFTGARRENVLGMRWQDFNFDAGMWTVPGEVSKNGSPLTLSLSSTAIELLHERKKRVGSETAFVFPAKSRTGYMSAPKKMWGALLHDAGISDLRLHDLCRSLGSWLAMTGASLHITGTALGHKSTEATKVYARLQGDAVKSALDLATTTILNKGGFLSLTELVQGLTHDDDPEAL